MNEGHEYNGYLLPHSIVSTRHDHSCICGTVVPRLERIFKTYFRSFLKEVLSFGGQDTVYSILEHLAIMFLQ